MTIPSFEGRTVDGVRAKFTGPTPQDEPDLVVSLGDIVRMVGTYRVMGVQFLVDTKTGDLVREQLLQAESLRTTPWDHTDPTDDGVLRARPSMLA